MRLLRKSWLVSALLCFVSTSAFAQTITDMELGETRQQKAGSASDMYRFTGLTGTTVTATLTTQGDAGLVFYTPDGEEMHSVKGNGTVNLDIIVPFPDVYFVSVIRADATKAYSLKLNGDLPDDHLANFAAFVGYQSDEVIDGKTVSTTQCWVQPGIRLRMTATDGLDRVDTIGRGGMQYTAFRHSDGRISRLEDRVTFDGTKIIFTPQNYKQTPTIIENQIAARKDTGPYRGYLCP